MESMDKVTIRRPGEADVETTWGEWIESNVEALGFDGVCKVEAGLSRDGFWEGGGGAEGVWFLTVYG